MWWGGDIRTHFLLLQSAQTTVLVTGAFRCLNDVIKIIFPTLPLRLCFSLSLWPNSLLIQICSLFVAGNMANGSPNPLDNLINYGIKRRHSLFPNSSHLKYPGRSMIGLAWVNAQLHCVNMAGMS